MPKTSSADFVANKNAQEKQPRWLYKIETDTNPLYLTNEPGGITFDGNLFRDDVSIAHGGIGENIEGRMDRVQLLLGNAEREIQSLLESDDGLRGKKVTIWQIFADDLAADSFLSWDFTVDSVSSSVETIVLDLVWQGDLLSRMVPTKLYARKDFPSAPAPDQVVVQ